MLLFLSSSLNNLRFLFCNNNFLRKLFSLLQFFNRRSFLGLSLQIFYFGDFLCNLLRLSCNLTCWWNNLKSLLFTFKIRINYWFYLGESISGVITQVDVMRDLLVFRRRRFRLLFRVLIFNSFDIIRLLNLNLFHTTRIEIFPTSFLMLLTEDWNEPVIFILGLKSLLHLAPFNN